MQIQFKITYSEFKKFHEQTVYSTVNIKRTKILYTVFIFFVSLLLSLSFLTINPSFFLSILISLLMYTYGTKEILKIRSFLSVSQLEENFPRTYTFKFDEDSFLYINESSHKIVYEIPWFRVNSVIEFNDFYLLKVKKIGKNFIVKKRQAQQDNIPDSTFQKYFSETLSKNDLL